MQSGATIRKETCGRLGICLFFGLGRWVDVPVFLEVVSGRVLEGANCWCPRRAEHDFFDVLACYLCGGLTWTAFKNRAQAHEVSNTDGVTVANEVQNAVEDCIASGVHYSGIQIAVALESLTKFCIADIAVLFLGGEIRRAAVLRVLAKNGFNLYKSVSNHNTEF